MKPNILKKLALLARADGMDKTAMLAYLAEKCKDEMLLNTTVTEVCNLSDLEFSEIKKDFVKALDTEC